MEKLKIFLVVCFSVLTGTMAMGQTVTGKVTDSEGLGIDGATVVMLDEESSFIEAAITDADGTFTFEKSLERFRLIVQHVMYETLELDCNNSEVGEVTMTSKDFSLDEIVIRGERPAVKVEGSRLTYDMSRMSEIKIVDNAYDCLLQLPGISEDDGELTLAGANSLSIILNGRPSSMTNEQLLNLLKSIPASRVEKAEVMYSAPPQYHVRGAAINLRLKGYSGDNQGLQGEINLDYAHQKKNDFNGRLNLVYTSQKWNVDMLYKAGYNNTCQDADTYSLHSLDGEQYGINQITEIRYEALSHQLRFSAEYKPTTESSISLTYNGTFSPDGKETSISEGYFGNSFNDTDMEKTMHNLAIDYVSPFGMTVGVDYTYYNTESVQSFEGSQATNGVNEFTATSGQTINKWKAYIDQSHNLPNDWTLGYGTSFTYADDHNTQFYSAADGTDMSESDTDSSYGEYTYNIYGSIGKSFGEKLSLSASLTAEYYKMANTHEWSFYPSASLAYTPSEQHVFQLSLTSDKTYPSYWDLSESVSYLNSYQETWGNPLLKPSSVYTLNLNYIFKRKYVFGVSYSYQPDAFAQLAYQSTERLALIYQPLNWDYLKSFNAVASVPFKLGKWLDSNLTLQAIHNHARCDDFFDISFDHSKWTFRGTLRNNIAISSKPNIRMELTAMALTKSIQGSYTVGDFWMLNAGLRWNSSNGKASLMVKADDIFGTGQGDIQLKTRNMGQYLNMNVDNHLQGINISFTYKFGGYKEKKHKEVDTSRFK